MLQKVNDFIKLIHYRNVLGIEFAIKVFEESAENSSSEYLTFITKNCPN